MLKKKKKNRNHVLQRKNVLLIFFGYLTLEENEDGHFNMAKTVMANKIDAFVLESPPATYNLRTS